MNRFKSIKLEDCKLIVLCGNITAKYIKDIKLRDSQRKKYFCKQGGFAKLGGSGVLLNKKGLSDLGCVVSCVPCVKEDIKDGECWNLL